MLLHRPAAAARVAKPELRARFDKFFRGDWLALLQEAEASSTPRPHPVDEPDVDARTSRAVHLAHLGELSAARQALLASPLAPGNDATLAELRDPARRPTEPYAPLESSVLNWSPPSPVALAPHLLLANLRRSRRGAAPGPSGHTAEIVRLLLDDLARCRGAPCVCAAAPLCVTSSWSGAPHCRAQAFGQCKGHRCW